MLLTHLCQNRLLEEYRESQKFFLPLGCSHIPRLLQPVLGLDRHIDREWPWSCLVDLSLLPRIRLVGSWPLFPEFADSFVLCIRSCWICIDICFDGTKRCFAHENHGDLCLFSWWGVWGKCLLQFSKLWGSSISDANIQVLENTMGLLSLELALRVTSSSSFMFVGSPAAAALAASSRIVLFSRWHRWTWFTCNVFDSKVACLWIWEYFENIWEYFQNDRFGLNFKFT